MFRQLKQLKRFQSTIKLNKDNINGVSLTHHYSKLIDSYKESIMDYKESTNRLIYCCMAGFGAFLIYIKQDFDKRFENIDKKFDEIKNEVKNDNKIFKDEIKELINRNNNRG